MFSELCNQRGAAGGAAHHTPARTPAPLGQVRLTLTLPGGGGAERPILYFFHGKSLHFAV